VLNRRAPLETPGLPELTELGWLLGIPSARLGAQAGPHGWGRDPRCYGIGLARANHRANPGGSSPQSGECRSRNSYISGKSTPGKVPAGRAASTWL
jgi:hypothetical protein